MDLQYPIMHFCVSGFLHDRCELILGWAVLCIWEILHFGLRVRRSCIPSPSFQGSLQCAGGMWPWTFKSLLVSLGFDRLGSLRWLISHKCKKQGKGGEKGGKKELVLFIDLCEVIWKGPQWCGVFPRLWQDSLCIISLVCRAGWHRTPGLSGKDAQWGNWEAEGLGPGVNEAFTSVHIPHSSRWMDDSGGNNHESLPGLQGMCGLLLFICLFVCLLWPPVPFFSSCTHIYLLFLWLQLWDWQLPKPPNAYEVRCIQVNVGW